MTRTRKTALSMVCCAVLLLNTACTTVRPIHLAEGASYAQELAAGDRVRLVYLDERVREIRISDVNEQEITGRLESGGLVIADWRDIYTAERVEISAIKTVGAAVGIVIAIPVLAALAVMSGCVTTYC